MYEERLYELICENSAVVDITDEKQFYRFSTSFMAQELNIPRSIASSTLNKLYCTGELTKINTRPVYYLSRTQLEMRFHVDHIPAMFSSVDQLSTFLQQNHERKDTFSSIIGHDKSLKTHIKQCKAAAYYPGTGLPLLISGPTGTGKSILAKHMHTFCLQKKLIMENAPFITFNCADYADNPELLTGVLFGYVKGAFTGADHDRVGILEQADNGILFLDEAHRLSSSGQEKLFIFMDQGIFNRLGEGSKNRRSKVRLIFSTTERPKDVFLETLLRRIPIHIHMPALEERSREEIVHLICHCLSNESRMLGRDLIVGQEFFKVLLHHKFEGNIGELKNAIKYACAQAYLLFCEQDADDVIAVQCSDLPDKIVNASNRNRHSNGWEWKLAPERIRISKNFRYEKIQRLVEKQATSRHVQSAYEHVYHAYLFAANQQADQTAAGMEKKLKQYMDVLVEEQKSIGSNIQLSVLDATITHILDNFLSAWDVALPNHVRHFLSLHFFRRMNFMNMDNAISEKRIKAIRSFLASEFPHVYSLTENLFQLFSINLEVRLKYADFIILALCIKISMQQSKTFRTKAIIVGNGYSAATSIANTVNRLLDHQLYDSIDLSPDIPEEAFAQRIRSITESADQRDLIVLVDTDRFVEQKIAISEQFTGSVFILRNITTQFALEVGRAIMQDLSAEEIFGSLSNHHHLKYNLYHSRQTVHRQTVITTCVTGIGTAEKIANLLRGSFSKWLPEVQFIPIEYNKLCMKGVQEGVMKEYKVSMIIGTADPHIEGIPFVNIGDILTNNDGENKLSLLIRSAVPPENIKQVTDQLIKDFSLQRVIESLTILNPEKVMSHVEAFIGRLEYAFHRHFDHSIKLLLFVHVSCMIERLIKNRPVTGYGNQRNFIEEQKTLIKAVEDSFSVIAEVYSVKIPIEEIGYIYDIVTMKRNSVSDEQEI